MFTLHGNVITLALLVASDLMPAWSIKIHHACARMRTVASGLILSADALRCQISDVHDVVRISSLREHLVPDPVEVVCQMGLWF